MKAALKKEINRKRRYTSDEEDTFVCFFAKNFAVEEKVTAVFLYYAKNAFTFPKNSDTERRNSPTLLKNEAIPVAAVDTFSMVP